MIRNDLFPPLVLLSEKLKARGYIYIYNTSHKVLHIGIEHADIYIN
jgi:hypothetical protein